MSLSPNTLWSPIQGGITSPIGFKASGISAGLKASGKPDLALLLAPEGAVCAGTFTKSSIQASCINICRSRLEKTGGRARAVLINSGHANACTGDRGLIDSLRATEALAYQIGLEEDEILISSTGVIGQPIPMPKLLCGLNRLVKDLSDTGGMDAAHAILTTDLVEKQIAFEAILGDRKVRIGGMAKGSGMIHPDMATMLAYLSCDAAVPPDVWNEMVKRAVAVSFNSITVDGDTSTNDSFIAFAAGELLSQEFFEMLEVGLIKVSQYLAKAIARDGEGSSCLIEVQVDGTDNADEARRIARTICGSSLVKTAVHGADPNWGRILAALGRSGVDFNLSDIGLWLGPYKLIEAGQPISFNRTDVCQYLQDRLKGQYLIDDSVSIRLLIGKGKESARAWGCDLSAEYVRINADYTT